MRFSIAVVLHCVACLSWLVLFNEFLASKTVLYCLSNFAKRTFAVLTRLSSHPLILGLLLAACCCLQLVLPVFGNSICLEQLVSVCSCTCFEILKKSDWKIRALDILYQSTCKPKKQLDSDFLKGNFDNGTPEKVCWNVHFLEMFRQDD